IRSEDNSPKNTLVSISPSGDILEGSSVTLTCNSKANPPVDTYSWFKNGAEISQRGSMQDYDITNITSEDNSGEYHCEARPGQTHCTTLPPSQGASCAVSLLHTHCLKPLVPGGVAANSRLTW
uniref:Ig-like domain-containing protein n=1 Tax=Scleropages formosus TaxID=113540 RepID=A0A8C9W747_SCLFO